MFKKRILIIFFTLAFIYPQSFLNPPFQSAILPGWGQKELGNQKNYKFFILTEVSLWVTCLASYSFSKHIEYKFQTYASEHAGIKSFGKNRQYWVDIGNYLTTEQHDAEHLRWREHDALYDDNQLWSWDSEDNMKEFEKLRIKSDQLAIRGKFIVGAIIVNHIISSIDALYLKKISSLNSIKVIPLVFDKNPIIKLEFSF